MTSSPSPNILVPHSHIHLASTHAPNLRKQFRRIPNVTPCCRHVLLALLIQPADPKPFPILVPLLSLNHSPNHQLLSLCLVVEYKSLVLKMRASQANGRQAKTQIVELHRMPERWSPKDVGGEERSWPKRTFGTELGFGHGIRYPYGFGRLTRG